MKTPMTLTLMALLAGCSPDGVAFDLVSALPGATSGVALDGERARVGMADQVCDVEVRTATIAADFEATSGEEHVFASRGEFVVGVVDGQLFHRGPEGVRLFEGAARAGDLTVSDEAVGLLAVDGACEVVFGNEGFRIDGLDCSGTPGFAYDAADDAVWIADGTHLALISSTGDVLAWQAEVDTVAWTGSHAVVGKLGHDTLSAVATDGTTLWSSTVGSVAAVVPGPTTGDVAVLIDEGAAGATLTLHSADGLPSGDFPLPSLAGVTFSPDTLALETPDGVLFYGVVDPRSPFDTSSLSHDGKGSTVGIESTLGVAGVFVATALILD